MSTRSIPACAGEPSRLPDRRAESRVYPRVCGGTLTIWRMKRGCKGLSPRVRGNLAGTGGGTAFSRSIPACAGEPQRLGPDAALGRVYPRVCGGTNGWLPGRDCYIGLSPRVRGNRTRFFSLAFGNRSIPACAGEPCRTCWMRQDDGVYPRVCGGTGGVALIIPPAEGLSPRVRGNRSRSSGDRASTGSIPACAGEPSRPRPGRRLFTVYPRVCGGT